MTDTKHTWGYDGKGVNDRGNEYAPRIATLSADYNTREIGNLIAAAPETAAVRDRLRAVNAELLEALGDAIAMLEHYQSGRADNWTRGRALSTIKDARTAIAKARGE